jgi:hypothetical protein
VNQWCSAGEAHSKAGVVKGLHVKVAGGGRAGLRLGEKESGRTRCAKPDCEFYVAGHRRHMKRTCLGKMTEA